MVIASVVWFRGFELLVDGLFSCWIASGGGGSASCLTVASVLRGAMGRPRAAPDTERRAPVPASLGLLPPSPATGHSPAGASADARQVAPTYLPNRARAARRQDTARNPTRSPNRPNPPAKAAACGGGMPRWVAPAIGPMAAPAPSRTAFADRRDGGRRGLSGNLTLNVARAVGERE